MEKKDKIEQTLEFDVLEEVPPPETERSDETPHFAEREDKTHVPGKMGRKKKIFVFSFLGASIVVLAVVGLSLTRISLKGVGSGATYAGKIVYVVSSSLDERHDVRFKLSVPFKDNKEKADLMEKLPRIKEELSRFGSCPDLVISTGQKDLKALKKHILKIVNDLTGVPIEKLHLGELTLDQGSAP